MRCWNRKRSAIFIVYCCRMYPVIMGILSSVSEWILLMGTALMIGCQPRRIYIYIDRLGTKKCINELSSSILRISLNGLTLANFHPLSLEIYYSCIEIQFDMPAIDTAPKLKWIIPMDYGESLIKLFQTVC